MMRLNTKGRFAVTAMIDLAMRADQCPVTLAAIGRRQQISLSYLEQLFGKLRRRELVTSTRGPGGGYSLGRDASGISVADIIAAVDEPHVDDPGKGGAGAGSTEGGRMTRDLWAGLDSRMFAYLASVSLKELVEDQIAKGVSTEEPLGRRKVAIAPMGAPARVTGPNSIFALGAALASTAAEQGTPRLWRQGRRPAFTSTRRSR